MPPRKASPIAALLLAPLALALAAVGCGSGDDAANESETTRAIREKVRQDMEKDRLRAEGRRLAFLNESLANAPTAVVSARAEAGGEGESSGGGTDLDRGQALYERNCASCHGARGEGDGPLAATLQPQPAKHSDGEYMNALSDDYLFKVVAEGGAAVGKSPMMAPWGPSMSDQEIRDVIAFMRTLADPPYEGGGESPSEGAS